MDKLDEENEKDWAELNMYVQIIERLDALDNSNDYNIRKQKAQKLMEKNNWKEGDGIVGCKNCSKCWEIRAYLKKHDVI